MADTWCIWRKHIVRLLLNVLWRWIFFAVYGVVYCAWEILIGQTHFPAEGFHFQHRTSTAAQHFHLVVVAVYFHQQEAVASRGRSLWKRLILKHRLLHLCLKVVHAGHVSHACLISWSSADPNKCHSCSALQTRRSASALGASFVPVVPALLATCSCLLDVLLSPSPPPRPPFVLAPYWNTLRMVCFY